LVIADFPSTDLQIFCLGSFASRGSAVAKLPSAMITPAIRYGDTPVRSGGAIIKPWGCCRWPVCTNAAGFRRHILRPARLESAYEFRDLIPVL